jgi:small subunit ribosomal protein S3
MSAVKNVIKNNFRNMELNEFFAAALKDAGYGGIDVQKTAVGAWISV